MHFCDKHKTFVDELYVCEHFFCRICKSSKCLNLSDEDDREDTDAGICDSCQHAISYRHWKLKDWWDDLLTRLKKKHRMEMRIGKTWINGAYWWIYCLIEWIWTQKLKSQHNYKRRTRI